MSEREHFRLRSYQRAPLVAMHEGCKRFVTVWHRRAGKDRTWLAITLLAMLQRVGTYFHVLPSLNQARRNVWDATAYEQRDGREVAVPMLSMFPPELIAPNGRNETEMQIRLVNGSVWQAMGADSLEAVERLRGPNPVGIVFSEYSYMLPSAWETLSPVLAENRGWAAFAFTPNGPNHAKDLYEIACADPEWFCQRLSIDDTRRDAKGEDGGPVVPVKEIEAARREHVREASIQQEYYVSFEGFRHGTIYGDLIAQARREGRIGRAPWVSTLPVGTVWDIGVTDATAIWFYQRIGAQIQFIDYHEDSLKGAQHYARLLREQRPYLYGRLVLPHDARWSAGEYFLALGFRGVEIAPLQKVQVGIDMVRALFSQFVFDERQCALGLGHLEAYARQWDDKLGTFQKDPLHDKHSHAADALRTGATGGFDPLVFLDGLGQDVKVESDFDPRAPLGQAPGWRG